MKLWHASCRMCTFNILFFLIAMLCVPQFLFAVESDVHESVGRYCSMELKIQPPNLQANINKPIGQGGGGVNSEVTCA